MKPQIHSMGRMHSLVCYMQVVPIVTGSRDSVVGITIGDGGVGVRVPVGSRFSLLRVVQTGSGVHPTFYPMGTGGSFPGGKAAGP
jgi:hypothetical protein